MFLLPRLVAVAAIGLGLAGVAGAGGASWPITPTVEYPQGAGANGKAVVRIGVGDDASAIEVEVYGLDGMRAGDDNHVRVARERLRKGESFAFDVPFQPGPGRSMLVVSAKARFAHAGAGGTLRSFPFGEESAEQRAEHSRCVQRDPQGVWIRLPDCDDDAPQQQAQVPPSPMPQATARPTLTVGQFRAAPPVGQTARIVGYVVDAYRCPPCPKGAMCKPCASLSAVFLAETPNHAPFALDRPPADVAAIRTGNPEQYERGVQYRLEISVSDRKLDHFDGQALRSQRADREPIWADEK